MRAYRPDSEAAWREELTERAAILEFEAGFSRADADRLALEQVGPWPPKPQRSLWEEVAP